MGIGTGKLWLGTGKLGIGNGNLSLGTSKLGIGTDEPGIGTDELWFRWLGTGDLVTSKGITLDLDMEGLDLSRKALKSSIACRKDF